MGTQADQAIPHFLDLALLACVPINFVPKNKAHFHSPCFGLPKLPYLLILPWFTSSVVQSTSLDDPRMRHKKRHFSPFSLVMSALALETERWRGLPHTPAWLSASRSAPASMSTRAAYKKAGENFFTIIKISKLYLALSPAKVFSHFS